MSFGLARGMNELMAAPSAPSLRWLPVCSMALLLPLAPLALGQTTTAPVPARPAAATVEPGLEQAVKWRWLPQTTGEDSWGLSLAQQAEATETASTPATPGSRASGPPSQALEYEVQKGDSLYVIAKRHGVTVDQIKTFNDMKRDIISIGQKLNIPGIVDIQKMAPPPPPPLPNKTRKGPVKAEPVDDNAKPGEAVKVKVSRPLPSAATSVARTVILQAYLDRQGFSAGPIDGTEGPLFDDARRLYEETHPGELAYDLGQPPAVLREMGGAYAEYQLKKEDLRWFTPEPPPPPKSSKKSKAAPVEEPEVGPTLESLTAAPFLPYRSSWEFVAERFHCSESFLRRINPGLKSPVPVGALFFVPNVQPFEIENALKEPLQPVADPAVPVTATIVNNTRLEIRQGEKLVANMPVVVARPGLRGRGTWRILQAIPRPKLVTSGDEAAPFNPPLQLPPGPNNPVGLVWIDLAKGSAAEPLPYGLHGTSIPGHMRKQESVGGFRMTNWNVIHAMRLLPAGTPLTWR